MLPTVYVVMYTAMTDVDEPVPVAVFPDKHSAKVWVSEQDWSDDFYLVEVPMHPESVLCTCGNPEDCGCN